MLRWSIAPVIKKNWLSAKSRPVKWKIILKINNFRTREVTYFSFFVVNLTWFLHHQAGVSRRWKHRSPFLLICKETQLSLKQATGLWIQICFHFRQAQLLCRTLTWKQSQNTWARKFSIELSSDYEDTRCCPPPPQSLLCHEIVVANMLQCLLRWILSGHIKIFSR